jgi:hypothetical protein
MNGKIATGEIDTDDSKNAAAVALAAHGRQGAGSWNDGQQAERDREESPLRP